MDSFTEHINQVLELYLYAFINYAQDNWEGLLLMAELAINNRDSILIGVSLFFLFYNYYIKLLKVIESL